jgi:diguanylate cyclase (GGDEF)-like protein
MLWGVTPSAAFTAATIARSVIWAVVLVMIAALGLGWRWRRSVRTLAARTAFYRQLVEELPVGVTACDTSGEVVVMNRVSRQRAGLPADPEVTTEEVFTAIEGTDIRAVDSRHRLTGANLPYRRALAGLDTDAVVILRPPRPAEDPAGEPVSRLKLCARPLRDEAGTVIGAVGINLDISDQHEARRRLAHQVESIEAIAAAVRAVLRRQDGPASIITAARTITGACLVALFQPDGHGDLICTASAHPDSIGMRMPLTTRAAMTACTTATPVWADILPDPRVDAGLFARVEPTTGARVGSAAWYPIVGDGRCLGLLGIGCPPGVPPPSSHRAALDLMASEIALALSHQDLILELERLSGADPLTGIANRRTWQTHLDRELPRAHRDQAPLSVLLIDLDRFKDYNDRHGHTAGDEHLRTVTELWRRRLRPSDLLCRWGGEEFAVLLPQCALAGAHLVAEDLRTAMPPGTTCSVGVAEWDHHESHQALIDRADRCLYDAKSSGRNRVRP